MSFSSILFKTVVATIYLCSWQVFANTHKDITGDKQSHTKEINCEAVDLQSVKTKSLTEYIAKQPFTLLGKAKFSVLFWDIYESSLLTSDGKKPFNQACQQALFEIQYLRDISKKDLLDNTVSQWQHLSLKESEYSLFLPLLESIWLDINAGDRLSMLTQHSRTLFYLNSQYIGEIESVTFAETFLSIWIDKGTSEPKLRLKLLG